MPDAPAPIPLPYARHSATRRPLRITVLFLSLLCLAVAAWITVPKIHRYIDHRLYVRHNHRWYAAAATWSQPPDTLKYTENPADAPPGGFVLRYQYPNTRAPVGFQGFGGSPVEKMPVLITGGRQALVGGPSHGHLFMHERTTSAGRKRLLVVHQPAFEGNVLHLRVEQVALHRGVYRTVWSFAESIDLTGVAGPGEIRLYAGQPDPADPSRFAIGFEARGRRGRLLGAFEPGTSLSDDPHQARAEADANRRVKFTVQLDPPTTQKDE